jgi:hypothetical protein
VAAEDSVHILGNGGSQDPEFQKEYLKLVDEEPTPGMPNETQKLVRDLPRDTEIVALLKRRLPTVIMDATRQGCK